MTADDKKGEEQEILPLEEIRVNITRIDNELLKLLAERRSLSLMVARSKVGTSKPVRDAEREEALLHRLVSQGKQVHNIDPTYVLRIFHTIIEDSVLVQQAYLQTVMNPGNGAGAVARIAFLGPKGSYSHQAQASYFARKQITGVDVSCASFREILSVVDQGNADYGILPIENACSGSITDVYDQLQHTTLSIVGEVTLPLDHSLLVADVDTTLDQIETIYSHPQPFVQCSEFLDGLSNATGREFTKSTADGMEKVSELKSPTVAAIGSAATGKLYGLKPLALNISNSVRNWTRFIIVAPSPVEVTTLCPAKTTLLMITGQYPGALVHCLEALKLFNMTKLESRPNKLNSGEYMFFVDIMANTKDEKMKQALEGLAQRTRYLQVLGCYPIENVVPTNVALESTCALENGGAPTSPTHTQGDKEMKSEAPTAA